MEFNSVKKIINDSNYWNSLLCLKNQKLKYLTTEFTITNTGVGIDLCSEDDDFYLGDFIIVCNHKGVNHYSKDDYIMYDLYYKELKYSNTLYIDFTCKRDTYTKAIRMKKNENLYSKRVQGQIKNAVCELKNLYMMTRAVDYYPSDNLMIRNIEKRIKKLSY